MTSQIRGIGRRCHDVAKVDGADGTGVDGRLGESCLGRVHAELGGGQLGQRSTEGSKCRALGTDDVDGGRRLEEGCHDIEELKEGIGINFKCNQNRIIGWPPSNALLMAWIFARHHVPKCQAKILSGCQKMPNRKDTAKRTHLVIACQSDNSDEA